VPSLLLLVRCCFSLAAGSEIAGVLLCARSRDNTAGGQAGRQAGRQGRLCAWRAARCNFFLRLFRATLGSLRVQPGQAAAAN
jgi:hypothetical protein